MIRSLKIGNIALILVAALSTLAAASEEIIYHKEEKGFVSLGIEVSSGKYGTSNSTTAIYMPLVATWFPTNRIDVGVEIPFVYQSTSYTTTISGQVAVPASTVTRGRGYRSTMSTNTATTSTTASSESSASGIGDLIFRFGVIALFENDTAPQLRPSVYIKAPTASTSDGLGTGRLDAGFGIEGSKWIGKTHLAGEVFYNHLGDASGLNNFSFTTGVGYQITENLQPMLLLKGSTSASSGSDGLLEFRARLLCTITKTTSLDMFISNGISRSSPDFGGGIAAIYSF